MQLVVMQKNLDNNIQRTRIKNDFASKRIYKSIKSNGKIQTQVMGFNWHSFGNDHVAIYSSTIQVWYSVETLKIALNSQYGTENPRIMWNC